MSTKTESTTPKADPIGAASQPGFDPMAAWAASQEMFHKMMGEATGRAQAFAGEYAALEAQMIARARAAIESWAQLAQDAIAYSAQLSAQARKLGLETAQRFGVGA